MKVKIPDPLRCEGQIPCTKKDREIFKEVAARRRTTMVKLFHEVIEKYFKE